MLASVLVLLLAQKAPAAAPPAPDVLLEALTKELARSKKGLPGEKDAPLYYLSYRVTDGETWGASASFGALEGQSGRPGRLAGRVRLLDVMARVGTRDLDNTHKVRGSFDFDFGGGGRSLPIDDDQGALEVALWKATDDTVRAATKDLLKVRANVAVKVAEEDKAPDFSNDKPQTRLEPKAKPLAEVLDREAWEARLRRLSQPFKTKPNILRSSVSMQVSSTTHYFVDSDGAKLREPRFFARLGVWGTVRADDGMELDFYDAIEATSPDALPTEADFEKRVARAIERLEALRAAPAIEPYVGPAIITHRAAGVFFHEIFGHRIEGHRQKDADEGKTFTKKVGQQIVPDFISVTDDPTKRNWGELPLNGFYLFDEEGQPAQKVNLVEKGVLKTFLLGRSPVKGFANSNGHGRAQPGLRPVARQGNLIIESSKQLPAEQLRAALLDEVKKRGKPYGLLIEEISGGFTNTRAGGAPQAFKVIPQIVYRVYPDGRPDELVRGVDLVGTPIASFERILVTGDDAKVFNGFCGAESGWVPVSAIAPSLLISDLEVERKGKGHEKGPLLPPPPLTGAAAAPAKGGAK
ncbi:MAG: metallopeptidase TldD-related protein [Myxococcaceae bacterium]|nr:metallopeptidase TldD-related protein [Myxococcaceae bacterium]